jgi:predicted DNA-binding transcriptional regulator YafY
MQWSEGLPRRLAFDSTRIGGVPDYASAVAACFGASLAGLFAGTPYENGLRRALEFVVDRTKGKAGFRDLERKFFFVTKGGEQSLPGNGKFLEALIRAVLESHWVRIEYAHFDSPSHRIRLQPYTLAIYQQQLYVIGCEKGKRPHPYRFSRITAVELLGESYRYPSKAEYDPEASFRSTFGIVLNHPGNAERVRVKLAARWAKFVLGHRWHRSQNVTIDNDGAPIVEFHCRTCVELQSWILGFGHEAEVLEPADLRSRIAATLKQATAIYESADRPGRGPSRRKG